MKLSSRGFTFLEILIVVAIAGIIVAMAMTPSAMLTQKSQFESNKVELRDLIQKTRNNARAQHECVSLFINGQVATVYGYTLSPPAVTAPACLAAPNNATPYPIPAFFQPPQIPIPAGITILQSFTFDSSVTLNKFSAGGVGGSINPIVFNKNGGTDYGTTISTTITQGKLSATFQILSLLGQIEEQ